MLRVEPLMASSQSEAGPAEPVSSAGESCVGFACAAWPSRRCLAQQGLGPCLPPALLYLPIRSIGPLPSGLSDIGSGFVLIMAKTSTATRGYLLQSVGGSLLPEALIGQAFLEGNLSGPQQIEMRHELLRHGRTERPAAVGLHVVEVFSEHPNLLRRNDRPAVPGQLPRSEELCLAYEEFEVRYVRVERAAVHLAQAQRGRGSADLPSKRGKVLAGPGYRFTPGEGPFSFRTLRRPHL